MSVHHKTQITQIVEPFRPQTDKLSPPTPILAMPTARFICKSHTQKRGTHHWASHCISKHLPWASTIGCWNTTNHVISISGLAVKCPQCDKGTLTEMAGTCGLSRWWWVDQMLYNDGGIFIYFLFILLDIAFSALTLLAGHQEQHPYWTNWVMRCWSGYLSGARCKWFRYVPADATATSSLASLKSRMVLPFWCRITQVVLDWLIDWVGFNVPLNTL